MKARLIPLLGLLAASALTFPLLAHHSISAEFDSASHVKLTGKVTNIDWMNPHTYVFIEVRDSALGKTRTWACELSSPTDLARQGLTKESLKIGMSVLIVGTRAKDGSFKLHTQTLSADNSVLFGK